MLKIASRTPAGSAIAVAIPVMMSVPTIAFLIPPPAPPNGAAFWVKKSTLSAGAARFATEMRTIASAAAAVRAAAVATASMT